MKATEIQPEAIFANNELNLGDIDVYGFDYDYTLAAYNTELHDVIYRLGQQTLIEKYKYPENILKLKYNPDWAIRGLHYDVRKGLLMKLDSFHNIQLGTVYRGLKSVSDREVKSLYNGTHVSLDNMNTFYGQGPMHQLVDLFALPEVALISDITEYLLLNNINYDPEYVFYDVRNAIHAIHSSGILHQKIMENLEIFLQKCDKTKFLLERLRLSGKKLFLITNSGYAFVDAGLKYMIGEDWGDMFDVIIVNARKPKFFNETSRPFRQFDVASNKQSWASVQSLQKGHIYQQGNFSRLKEMTGWYGGKVLYFGDHVYSDLADPSLKHGWRTAAIIPELKGEIEKLNQPDYQYQVKWLVTLQNLIEDSQHQISPGSKALIEEWLAERDEIRDFTKAKFNPRFGSLFRTYHNPTYFSRRLGRFADLYMSSLVNLLHYSVDHTFYPRRSLLPHEPNPF
ncbi:hypothetical protein SNE40_021312 [Patella caerulea]|uniref:5'-nucleotidase domain-containing protein 3 n=1 Tax=Patella caerulea TaxID=87958 RepID=A0AAN8G3P9_PATCE